MVFAMQQTGCLWYVRESEVLIHLIKQPVRDRLRAESGTDDLALRNLNPTFVIHDHDKHPSPPWTSLGHS